MDRNLNTNQIIISKELFDEIRNKCTLDKKRLFAIDKHVRKFNPFLQEEHQQAVRNDEKYRSECIRKARQFANHHHGKTVYVPFHSYDLPANENFYATGKVHGVAKDRQFVLIDMQPPYKGKVTYLADNILLEIPEGYTYGYGQYKGILMSANSHQYTHRDFEVVIQNDNEYVDTAIRFGHSFDAFAYLDIFYNSNNTKPEDFYKENIAITKLFVMENNTTKVINVNIPFNKHPEDERSYYLKATIAELAGDTEYVLYLVGDVNIETGKTIVICSNINCIGYKLNINKRDV